MKINRSICLAGAAPDTGNHGVTALGISTLVGLIERGSTSLTVFDHGSGHRTDRDLLAGHDISRLGCRPGRNFLKAETQLNALLRQILGLHSPVVEALTKASALLDVSGGDSFSDIYGQARFDQIIRIKKIALAAGCPLILLPQTYGPFRSARNRRVARKVISQARLAFARDAKSYTIMQALLGADFDPQRHRLGVDLAFGLPACAPKQAVGDYTIGINVSGLLWHDPISAAARFGLSCSYRDVMVGLVQRFLDKGHRVMLIPHVIAPHSAECDTTACSELMSGVHGYEGQVQRYKGPYGPSELKGIISQCHWFAGSRMHATIAALSSGTPVVNMAYSDKAQGVFDAADVSAAVVDLRRHGSSAGIDAIWQCFEDRAAHAIALDQARAKLKATWHHQMNLINSACQPLAQTSARADHRLVTS